MKLLSFNIWGGGQGQVFFDYIKQQAGNIDIFCFQEIFSSQSDSQIAELVDIKGFQKISQLLEDYDPIFSSFTFGHIFEQSVDFEVNEGLAIFAKRGIEIKEPSKIRLEPDPEFVSLQDRFSLQHALLRMGGKVLSIFNIHGFSRPGDKLDTPKRLEQSKIILTEAEKFPYPTIICGDFNLMPETESIKMLDRKFKNLIKEFKITNTRNKISWARFNNIQCFADFTFVSPEIAVKSFEVPYNEVSDHLPMILEFDF